MNVYRHRPSGDRYAVVAGGRLDGRLAADDRYERVTEPAAPPAGKPGAGAREE